MDLTNIFDDEQQKPAPAAQPTDALSELAQQTAYAFDDYELAEALLKQREAVLVAEIEEQLALLRAKSGEEERRFKALAEALKAEMQHHHVDVVQLLDRPPARLKVTPGKKKAITKEWLEVTYGAPEAARIWNKVPKADPTVTVILPSRQPTSG